MTSFHLLLAVLGSELLTQQHSQSEETIYKLKQLLVKHKKELVEAKRREEELHNTMAELQKQLEMERQGSELAKVEVSQYTANIETMKQQVSISSHCKYQCIRVSINTRLRNVNVTICVN